jgi:hypothetical protein
MSIAPPWKDHPAGPPIADDFDGIRSALSLLELQRRNGTEHTMLCPPDELTIPPVPPCRQCDGAGWVHVFARMPPGFGPCPVCHNREGKPRP